jgi:large repetitive protein
LNGGFENPNFTPSSPQFHLSPDALVPGWSTNDSLGQIEIWDTGFLRVPSDSGDQFAELNANSAGTLVQTGIVNSRAELVVSWAHRARVGTDTATATIGDNVGTSVSTGNFSATTSAWVPHSQTIITGSSATQFNMAFTAVTAGSGSRSEGNFLDSVAACQTYMTSTNVITSQTTASPDGRPSVGDTITYKQTISNPAGNLKPLTGITIDDTLTGNGTSVSPVSGDTNNDGVLDPGETWTFDVVYTLTAADIAAGQVVTQSHANGNTGANILRSDDTIITTPLPVIATNDTNASPIVSGVGQSNAYNVFDNDVLKGAAPTPANVTLSVVTPASNPGVTLDTATGNVSVAPGTPAGTYTIDYKICETANPANCANAKATVVVSAPAPISAADDTKTGVNGITGDPAALDLFNGDTLNGAPATSSNTTLSVASGSVVPTQLTFDPATGVVAVKPGTPAGTYSFDYEICETSNPTNCKVATATVIVDAAPIVATDDSASGINGTTGATAVANAFTSDTIGGAAASPSNATVTLKTGTTVPTGLTFNPATGSVDVVPGTPAGSYVINYTICEKLNPTNCKDAKITVDVVAAPITASPDAPAPVNGANGANDIINAFTNDKLNGVPVDPAKITATITSPATPGALTPILDPVTGFVDVPAGTPAGTYVIDYKICEKLNPANCADSQVTVVVQPPAIVAAADAPAPVRQGVGNPSAINAFANDKLNGVPLIPGNIVATILTPASNPGVVMDPATGNVSVGANVPAGTYTIEYEICERMNPANCTKAIVTVVVEASVIAATNDSATGINGATGATAVANAYTSDTVGGVAAGPDNAVVTLKTGTTVPAGLTFDPATGSVDVKPGTPAGSYVINYTLCEKINPTNCKDATITVDVVAAPIAATPDTPPSVSGATGNPSVTNAFANDKLNGVTVTPDSIKATIKSPASNPGVVLDPATGNVSVAPGTPAGSYEITYEICEKLNPSNCATSTVTVVVDPAPIVATNDNAAKVNGATGATAVANAFGSDTVGGVAASPSNAVLTLTAGTTVPAGLTFDPATGSVDVKPGTPAGNYVINYTLCEKLNPTNCKNATITVEVVAPGISASPDAPAPVNGANGGNDIINAFANDTLNGVAVDPAKITATITSPATPGALTPILDPVTGFVDVPAGTPAGTYVIDYKICEKLNPENCANSQVTVVVQPPVIAAATDTAAPVRQGVGNPNAINAFANDTLNGVPVAAGAITAKVLKPASNPGVVLDPATGNVSIGKDVPAGTYTIEYEICERANPANCAKSVVTVEVGTPISGLSGTVYTDLDGDRIPDANEPRRPDWIVEVLRDGKVVATTKSDAKGDYSVAGLDSGPGYSIRFRSPENNVVYDTIDNLTLAGNTTVVDQNKPIDPSGVIFNSETRTPVANAVVRLVGANGTPLPGTCFIDATQASQRTGASGEYRFDIVPGAAPECPVGEAVYTISVAPPTGFSGPSSVLPPLAGPLDPTGRGAPVRISPEVGAPQAATVPYYFDFRLAAGDPDIVNNHIPLDPFISRLPLIVTKTSPKRSANIGDVVPYEITVRNTENVGRSGVEVVDILPPGMKYVLGTASVNGIAQEPVRTDRKLSWEGQVIPANGSVRYNLTLVVGAGVTGGEKVNTGLAQNDADDVPISNRGTAVVTITPSAVFDCSELLGKVFEDRNYNGYQDEGEPGVPGVRLATVNGQLITTDAFGRYHIACAAVPDARIGSNFVLKIDTRTLPLGWEVTTDNPRSIRLTRGKFGEMNFGVAPPNQSDQGTAPNDAKKGE